MNRRNLLQLAAATPLLALPAVAEPAVFYPELHIWFDDVETVIAESPEDADALIKDLCGYEPGTLDGTPSERWTRLDGDKPLTIWWEGDELIGFDLTEKPVGTRPGWVNEKAKAITLTRAEWCAKLGRTYLGSTDC